MAYVRGTLLIAFYGVCTTFSIMSATAGILTGSRGAIVISLLTMAWAIAILVTLQ